MENRLFYKGLVSTKLQDISDAELSHYLTSMAQHINWNNSRNIVSDDDVVQLLRMAREERARRLGIIVDDECKHLLGDYTWCRCCRNQIMTRIRGKGYNLQVLVHAHYSGRELESYAGELVRHIGDLNDFRIQTIPMGTLRSADLQHYDRTGDIKKKNSNTGVRNLYWKPNADGTESLHIKMMWKQRNLSYGVYAKWRYEQAEEVAHLLDFIRKDEAMTGTTAEIFDAVALPKVNALREGWGLAPVVRRGQRDGSLRK